MQLVGGDHAELGVADLPPPLSPDDGDLDCVGRPRRRLDFVNHPAGGEHEDDDDDERHRSPRGLHLSAPIDLRRLRALLSSGSAKSHHAVRDQSPDDDKHDGAQPEHHPGQVGFSGRGSGHGREDARDRIGGLHHHGRVHGLRLKRSYFHGSGVAGRELFSTTTSLIWTIGVTPVKLRISSLISLAWGPNDAWYASRESHIR